MTDGIFQNWEEVNSHAFQSTETSPGDIRFKDLNNDGKLMKMTVLLSVIHLLSGYSQ